MRIRKIIDIISRYTVYNIYRLLFVMLILFFIFYKLKLIQILGVYMDEGIFIYKSWRILNGDILYHQIGEMRTPGHYFYFFIPLMLIGKLINLSSENMVLVFRYAITILEIITFYIIYKILDVLNVGKKFSILLISVIIISPFVLGWSVYAITENIAIMPFFLSILIFLNCLQSKNFSYMRLLSIGITTGLAILIRHSFIIFYIPMFFFILLTSRRDIKEFRNIFWFIIGIVIPFIPIFIYLVINGALTDFFINMTKNTSENVEWGSGISMPINDRYNHFLKDLFSLNLAISFSMFMGLAISLIKYGVLIREKIIGPTYLFMIIYIMYMFRSVTYNTKYIIPLVYFSIIVFGYYYSNVHNKNIKTMISGILSIFLIMQGANIVRSDYLKDPLYNDGYTTISLADQINLSKEIKKYDVTDKDWFNSLHLIITYLSQVDSYNHINIKSKHSFPSREEFIKVLDEEQVNLVVLDPTTRLHMSSKSWVNDNNSNISIQMKFRIIGKEKNKEDGLDICLKDNKNLTVFRVHTEEKYIKYGTENFNNITIFNRFINESEWTELNIYTRDIFNKQYDNISNRFYYTIILNADHNSSLTVDIDYIKVIDIDLGIIIFNEDFDNYKPKINISNDSNILSENSTTYLRMNAKNKLTKLIVGTIGNGVLSYIYLNYDIVEKIPMKRHQNTDNIVYTEILTRKNINKTRTLTG